MRESVGFPAKGRAGKPRGRERVREGAHGGNKPTVLPCSAELVISVAETTQCRKHGLKNSEGKLGRRCPRGATSREEWDTPNAESSVSFTDRSTSPGQVRLTVHVANIVHAVQLLNNLLQLVLTPHAHLQQIRLLLNPLRQQLPAASPTLISLSLHRVQETCLGAE